MLGPMMQVRAEFFPFILQSLRGVCEELSRNARSNFIWFPPQSEDCGQEMKPAGGGPRHQDSPSLCSIIQYCLIIRVQKKKGERERKA